ncbi:AhpD-like protein [Aspergillus pseudodeflectus]|uniref:AhpD-like protein n=1 Tax=Aspergillus pseudodeflectus TaxID=176178 RepID=A0ABR4L1L6_9EURO
MSNQQSTRTSNPASNPNPTPANAGNSNTSTSNPISTSTSQPPASERSDLFNLGLDTRRAVLGSAHVDRSLETSNAFTLPMQEMITEWAWGNVWNRPGLDRKQRSLLNIGLLIALDRQNELAMHVRGAVRNGLSEIEIREAVMHSTVYCGAPAGMEGMRTVDRVLGEMEAAGEIVRVIK